MVNNGDITIAYLTIIMFIYFILNYCDYILCYTVTKRK